MSLESFFLWQRYNVRVRLAALEVTIMRGRIVKDRQAERARWFDLVVAERFYN